MFIGDIAITSLETISCFEIGTGLPLCTLDELQTATIANTEDKQDITGKQGRKLTSLKRNKAVKVTGSNGMVSGGMLELQTGSKFANKATEVQWADYLTVTGNAAATNYTAVGTAGAEISHILVKDKSGVPVKQLTQAAELKAGVVTYNPADKSLKFNTGEIEDGAEIVAYYKRKIKADVLENLSDNYSGKCMMYVDAFGEDKCANVYHIQFFIPKADFSGNFDFAMGDNQTVHSFEAEALAGGCGGSSAFWTYTIFADDAEDVA